MTRKDFDERIGVGVMDASVRVRGNRESGCVGVERGILQDGETTVAQSESCDRCMDLSLPAVLLIGNGLPGGVRVL